MANIKILKEDQLVGGTDNTPVYPVSSTQAIYCQDSEGNVPQGVKPKLEDRLRDIENSMEASNYVIIRGQTIHVGTTSITVPSTASEVNALPNTTKYGYSFDLDLNTSTYVLTITLKDQDGTSLVSKNVDFPMESTVVNGSYNSQSKKIILTLKNNNTIDIPVADLISGLQSEITPVSPLDADLVDDTNSTHKFVTEQEKQAWTNKSGFSGNYNDLSGKPTNVSSFTNDAGYLTSTDIEQELSAKANTSDVYDKTTIDTALSSKQNTSLIIEVNYDNPSIPNGTYASITTALAAGKEVIVKLNNPLYTINCHLKGVVNSVYTFTSSFMVTIVNVIINPNDTISVNSDSVALESHLDGKASKVSSATQGNFAGLDATGNITDSGHSPSDYLQDSTLYIDNSGIDDYIEIGGIKWATKNLGATSITGSGLYFQWGDTTGYTAAQAGEDKVFSFADYKYTNDNGTTMTKYNSTDEKTTLDASDDAATSMWKGTWRIPTRADFQALEAATNVSYTSNYNNTGIAGLTFTDKTDNTKVLFFPAAGYGENSAVLGVNTNAMYGTASLYSSDVNSTYIYMFGSGIPYTVTSAERRFGCSIRPVLDTKQVKKDIDGKVDKVEDAVSGDIAILDSDGNISDSGVMPSNFQTKLSAQQAYNGMGSATHVPQITTNSLGQVTSITEVAISGTGAGSSSTTISTDIMADNTSDAKAVSPKAVYSFVSSRYQEEINTSNKLSSDLVDDTNKTNKFVTATEKTTWNNKSDFSGAYNDLSGKPNLATVATSGSYNDLSNKPTIPTVPINVSAFTNDAGYLTQHQSLANCVQSSTSGLKIEVVSAMPASPDNNTIYIVR